jgi:hypothetical protein
MSTRTPVSLVSIYEGRLCIGFVRACGPKGYQAYTADERDLGLFPTQRAAADAVNAAAPKEES